MTILAMWSGPRNISTAMMYAFGNRVDCEAWDEPFYGYSLKAKGNDHPMRDEIMSAMETDWDKLVLKCITPASKPLLYQKHMTHHMPMDRDLGFIHTFTNAFLIRDPAKVLASYAQKWADVDLLAIGVVQQLEIFDRVAQRLGHAPPVIDSDDILANPEVMLRKLCESCKIAFDANMLKWDNGPKPFDGVWAPHWYNAAWASTGFATSKKSEVVLPPELQKIADMAQTFFEQISRHKVR